MAISVKSLGVGMVVLSMLVLVPLVSTAPAAEEAAVFPVCYRCGTGLPGAPTLTIKGVVNSQLGIFQGVGTVTQAVSPPLNVQVPRTGHYDPRMEKVILNFFGGRPGEMVNGLLIVNAWGEPGKCEFYWFGNNRFGDSGGTVPAAPCK